MKPAEFEEKEYEGPLYNQLERSNRFLWQPGQVLEGYLGFDRTFLLDEGYLWHAHGIHRPYRGIVPYRFRWPFLPPKFKHRLPRFRVNCFIQAKRSEVGKKLSKRLTSLGTRRPYFRFAIDTNQQKTLETAARRLRKRALFVYAGPVFSKSRELNVHTTRGTIVENSTFPEVLAIAGHRAWYYNEPGANGVVNQGYEALRLPELNLQIASLIEQQGDVSEATLSPSDALVELRQELEVVVTQTSEQVGEARNAYLTEEWRGIESFGETTETPRAVIAFLGIEAFALHFNLAWLTIA